MKEGQGSKALGALTAVAGPVAVGAIMGMPGAAAGMLAGLSTIPAIVIGVVIATFPALYIACTMTGTAPPAERMVGHAGAASRLGSIALLGLAVPFAFLAASSRGTHVALILGVLVLGVGTLAALRSLGGALYAVQQTRTQKDLFILVFGGWSFLAISLGAALLFTHA